MESTYSPFQKENLQTTWYKFEPGNGTSYEFGLCKTPNFMQGCDGDYLLIITSHGFYPFKKDEFGRAVNSYHCEKLNMEKPDVEKLFEFICNEVLKGNLNG